MNDTSPQTNPPRTTAVEALRSVDRELIDTLRDGQRRGVAELTDALGVTATAVRQRLERLLEDGLIQRHKVVSGRGRPTFNYSLTVLGHRHAGADHGELAEAMWREIVTLPDESVRTRLLSGIARRLGQNYKSQLTRPDDPSGDALEQRMRELSKLMAGNRIPNDVTRSGEEALPVLGITACPYPDLTDASEHRSMCHLEEEMLSEALGREIQLTSCRLDGDHCCQFSPKDNATAT
ncbi:helix-turn-helix transcriptional regulator [Roseimaritima sediminicola]|uniref:helix-turn-helix transcriptional regulator n=1 Tax=Roseimaritima sediminicola TaxID=2662066 RepID=UPI001298248F|nr:winged helix-turn-helix transcriptional regulator [Roseimaritima sediminicola]